MTPHDRPEFAKLLLITADKYKRTFTESFLEMYWHSLKTFSLQDVQQAFKTHFNNPDNGHFLPHQSDILRILQGDSETQALLAWTKVMEAICSVGAYPSIVFDDLIIHAVIIDMGGWVSLCLQTQDELKFSEHKFQKRYRGYLLRRPQKYPNRLIGISEHQNQLSGHPVSSPVLFSDAQAAFITYSEGCDPQQLHAQKITLLSEFSESLALPCSSKTRKCLSRQENNNEMMQSIVFKKTTHHIPIKQHSNVQNPMRGKLNEKTTE